MSIQRTVDHLSNKIDNYDFETATRPFICGISGPQGSGKSYLAQHVTSQLQEKYSQRTIFQFLMDDLYLSHSKQTRLTESCNVPWRENRMLQGRGLPGTHDIDLALAIFQHFCHYYQTAFPELKVPRYNKAAFDGEGDQFDEDQWCILKLRVDIIIFEGWFNGFSALDDQQLLIKYMTADVNASLLPKHPLHNFQDINCTLKQYEDIWSYFDYFVLLQTDSIDNVYTWRTQQEHALIASGGKGMSDESVVRFVDRYMPMYEMYYEKVCEVGCLQVGRNLRLCLDSKRNLMECIEY